MSDIVIHKYPLDPGADIRIDVGPKSSVCSVAMQFMPVVWIAHEVDGDGDPVLGEAWEILLTTTGVNVPDGWEFLNTVQALYQYAVTDDSGSLLGYQPKFIVWHVWKRFAVDYSINDPHFAESILPTDDDAPGDGTFLKS